MYNQGKKLRAKKICARKIYTEVTVEIPQNKAQIRVESVKLSQFLVYVD